MFDDPPLPGWMTHRWHQPLQGEPPANALSGEDQSWMMRHLHQMMQDSPELFQYWFGSGINDWSFIHGGSGPYDPRGWNFPSTQDIIPEGYVPGTRDSPDPAQTWQRGMFPLYHLRRSVAVGDET